MSKIKNLKKFYKGCGTVYFSLNNDKIENLLYKDQHNKQFTFVKYIAKDGRQKSKVNEFIKNKEFSKLIATGFYSRLEIDKMIADARNKGLRVFTAMASGNELHMARELRSDEINF